MKDRKYYIDKLKNAKDSELVFVPIVLTSKEVKEVYNHLKLYVF